MYASSQSLCFIMSLRMNSSFITSRPGLGPGSISRDGWPRHVEDKWLGKCGSRGGDRGSGPPPPPGKSQVIWVSIRNKQLDPPPPLVKVGPPPLENGTLKNDRFLWNWPFDFCKISWGLRKKKKKKTLSELFFVRLAWTPPPLTKIPGSALAGDSWLIQQVSHV